MPPHSSAFVLIHARSTNKDTNDTDDNENHNHLPPLFRLFFLKQ